MASLDHDRILRSFLAVIQGVIRTNFYVAGRHAIALKLLPREIPELPEPRPEFEIFVYSPRMEGVHLRLAEWHAAVCVGPTVLRISGPRSLAWSRPRW